MADASQQAIEDSYNDVRSDHTPTTYSVIGYEGNSNKLVVQHTGQGDWNEFTSHFKDNEAQYGYARLITDQERKSSKFVFVAWVGSGVSVLKKGKISVHKASVKEKWKEFAVEKLADNIGDLEESEVLQQVIKAGGANYGTGKARV